MAASKGKDRDERSKGAGVSSDSPAAAPDRTLWHVGPAPAPRPKTAAPEPAAPAASEIDDLTPIEPVPIDRPNDGREDRRDSRRLTPVAVQLEPGDRVPGTRYQIVRFIGDGGMGAVYEAQHLDLERRVALKILLPELSRSPAAARLFRREARTASKVGSDHIVQLYDFGELPDGRLMFTMELLSGPTLGAEIRQNGPLPAARTIGSSASACPRDIAWRRTARTPPSASTATEQAESALSRARIFTAALSILPNGQACRQASGRSPAPRRVMLERLSRWRYTASAQEANRDRKA